MCYGSVQHNYGSTRAIYIYIVFVYEEASRVVRR